MSDKAVQSGYDGKVKVTFEKDVAIITVDCGENRFNESFVRKLDTGLDEVLRNPNVKAMVTTGVGKFFSNGLDLTWMTEIGLGDTLIAFGEQLTKLMVRFLTFPIPTVALLNGHAFAAGAIWPLCFDHVIMNADRGWWCLNEVHINRKFSPFNIELFKQKIPSGQSHHHAVILGQRFTATEAKSAGIVHEICSQSEMFTRAQEWIHKVVPPKGYNRIMLQTMKEDVYEKALDCTRRALAEGAKL